MGTKTAKRQCQQSSAGGTLTAQEVRDIVRSAVAEALARTQPRLTQEQERIVSTFVASLLATVGNDLVASEYRVREVVLRCSATAAALVAVADPEPPPSPTGGADPC